MYYAIHCAAKNDANGNPRRFYLVYDAAGNLCATVDEGYRGSRCLADVLPDGATCKVLARIPTTPAFRRDALRGAAEGVL